MKGALFSVILEPCELGMKCFHTRTQMLSCECQRQSWKRRWHLSAVLFGAGSQLGGWRGGGTTRRWHFNQRCAVREHTTAWKQWRQPFSRRLGKSFYHQSCNWRAGFDPPVPFTEKLATKKTGWFSDGFYRQGSRATVYLKTLPHKRLTQQKRFFFFHGAFLILFGVQLDTTSRHGGIHFPRRHHSRSAAAPITTTDGIKLSGQLLFCVCTFETQQRPVRLFRPCRDAKCPCCTFSCKLINHRVEGSSQENKFIYFSS